MAISVVMPALEMAQETGKLVSWLKKEGDSVATGDPLLEIETDKAVMEIESPGDGILVSVKAAPGDEVPVGQIIAWIVRDGEAPPTDEVVEAGKSVSRRNESGRKMTGPSRATTTNHAVPEPQPASETAKVSPKARRLANELNVNLAGLRGSGSGGEILASDILAAAESRKSAPATTAPANNGSAVARLMAERTTQSWTTVPHFFVVLDVDAKALNEARQKLGPEVEKSHAVKLTHSDLLVALVARALGKHPRMNASWAEDAVRENAEVNISLAMAVEDGVVAPVIKNANRIELGEIAVQRQALTERARTGKLRLPDLSGGTSAISNLGMFGVDSFTAIIIPPQAAILAIGAIVDRVVPFQGAPIIRPMLTLTLSNDHRVVDGAQAAAFLKDLAETIGDPLKHLAL
jgi:pyruvate dehydrogenase E2 component (dihydrolipoamide acetyltransferase)